MMFSDSPWRHTCNVKVAEFYSASFSSFTRNKCDIQLYIFTWHIILKMQERIYKPQVVELYLLYQLRNKGMRKYDQVCCINIDIKTHYE